MNTHDSTAHLQISDDALRGVGIRADGVFSGGQIGSSARKPRLQLRRRRSEAKSRGEREEREKAAHCACMKKRFRDNDSAFRTDDTCAVSVVTAVSECFTSACKACTVCSLL